MEKTVTPINVIVKTWDGKSSQKGKIKVETWEKKDRTKRALRVLFIGWGLAILSVFLPGAHFFLVPGFFFGSPVAAYIVSKQKSIVLGGESFCPSCGQHLIIVRGPENWPLEDICTSCQNHVRIEKEDF